MIGRSKSLCILGLLLCSGGVGCFGSQTPDPVLYQVKGTFLLGGKPVPNAQLTFHPQFEGPGWLPIAVVDQDGSFAASSKIPGDGIPEGNYKVTAEWRPTLDGEGPNQLPPRYANPATTPLQVQAGPAASSPVEFSIPKK